MLAVLLVAALTGAPCANPSIVSAAPTVTAHGAINHYTIAVTVQNRGDARQPGNLLQSVDVFQDGEKKGQLGLQPLGPKQSQRVRYGFDRSSSAGDHTTSLLLKLDANGRSGNTVDCHAGTDIYKLKV